MFKFSNYEKILFSVPDISPINIEFTVTKQNKKTKIFAANKAIERLFNNSSQEGFFATKIKRGLPIILFYNVHNFKL